LQRHRRYQLLDEWHIKAQKVKQVIPSHQCQSHYQAIGDSGLITQRVRGRFRDKEQKHQAHCG
jgi:hypothetical protein